MPRIKIVDERHQEVEDRIFYDKGSTIKLKCMVENIVGEQPEYIIWKKGNRMLNYDTEVFLSLILSDKKTHMPIFPPKLNISLCLD